MFGYLIVLLAVVLTTLIATPVLSKFAPRIGAIAFPGARSVHDKPMPLIGGIAMMLGRTAGLLTAIALSQFYNMFK